MVERINRFLKSSLKKLVENQPCWNTHVEHIQYVINNTYHSTLKASPSKLLFGYDQRNHCDSQLTCQYLHKLVNVEINFDEQRNKARDIVLEATMKMKKYNKAYYDEKHTKPSVYKPGDYVFIRDSILKPGEDSKLKPKYKGPYMITKALNKNRYVVQDIPECTITQRPYNSILYNSTDRIKPWIKPLE